MAGEGKTVPGIGRYREMGKCLNVKNNENCGSHVKEVDSMVLSLPFFPFCFRSMFLSLLFAISTIPMLHRSHFVSTHLGE